MTEFDGVVTILNKPAPAGQVMIALNGQLGDATLGGNGQIGALVLKNSENKEIARLGHLVSTPFLKPGTKPGSTPTPVAPASGALVLRDSSGGERVRIAAAAGGEVVLRGKDDVERFRVNASNGDASIGGNGVDGDVALESASSHRIVMLNAGDGDEIQVCEDAAKPKIVFAVDKNAFGDTRAGLFLGAHSTQGGKKPGIIAIRDENGDDGVLISAAKDGDEIAVDQKAGVRALAFDKNAFDDTKAGLFIGVHVSQGGKKPGIIALRDKKGNDSLLLDGDKGDIVLANADCAENFAVSEQVEPGTVVVLTDDGAVRASDCAYDTRVAGVVAGAGTYRPGILLDGGAGGDVGKPISLVGKVFCKVDDSNGPIEVGTLLTTSATPGHAMRASDIGRAFGAVLGKALAPHTAGNGLIPVLVGLQ